MFKLASPSRAIHTHLPDIFSLQFQIKLMAPSVLWNIIWNESHNNSIPYSWTVIYWIVSLISIVIIGGTSQKYLMNLQTVDLKMWVNSNVLLAVRKKRITKNRIERYGNKDMGPPQDQEELPGNRCIRFCADTYSVLNTYSRRLPIMNKVLIGRVMWINFIVKVMLIGVHRQLEKFWKGGEIVNKSF